MNTPLMRAAALTAALTACLTAALTAQTGWSEVRGAHYILRGGFDARHLSPIACDIEEAARAVGISGGGTSATAVMPSIIAVANESGVRELLPQFWDRRGPRPVGAYWTGVFGHHIVIRVDVRREERFRRVVHELAHFATHLAHPNPPRWLDEGLSEIWEHAAIEADRIAIGRPVSRHLKLLRSSSNWIPIADLLSATTLPGPKSGSKASLFYAQSWALVHYLLFEKGRGKLTFDQLSELGPFPTDAELRSYVRGTLGPAATIRTTGPVPGCPGPVQVRQVRHTESLILRARAVADGERPDAALPLLDEALRREPGNRAALETLGFVHFVGNRPQPSAVAFDRVISEGHESHLAYYYRSVLAASVPDLSDGSGPVPEVDYLRKAIRLSPGFQPARDRLQELLKKGTGCPGTATCARVSSTR